VCSYQLHQVCLHLLVLDQLVNFTDALCTIADSSIPKSKSKPVKLNTSWFNDKCKEVMKSQKKKHRENLIPTQHNTHTQQQLFYGPLSRTTQVSRYQKKHSLTHHPDHHPIFISFFHLPRSIASSLFKLRAWQSFCTTFFHVLFGLPLGLEPFTSYSIHFFTQSVSSFRCTCPYNRNLFCCSSNIISSIPSLSTHYLELYLLP